MTEILDWIRDPNSFFIYEGGGGERWSFIFNHLSWKIALGLLIIWWVVRIHSIIKTSILSRPSGAIYVIEDHHDATDGGMYVAEIGILLLADGLIGLTMMIALPYVIYGLLWAWPIIVFLGATALIIYLRNKPKKQKPAKPVQPKTNTEIYKESLSNNI